MLPFSIPPLLMTAGPTLVPVTYMQAPPKITASKQAITNFPIVHLPLPISVYGAVDVTAPVVWLTVAPVMLVFKFVPF
jgi:hypothetical protein